MCDTAVTESLGDFAQIQFIVEQQLFHLFNFIPDDIPLEIGGTLNMHNGQQAIPVIVREISATKVKLDANHELAGKDLIFEIELVSVR